VSKIFTHYKLKKKEKELLNKKIEAIIKGMKPRVKIASLDYLEDIVGTLADDEYNKYLDGDAPSGKVVYPKVH